MNKTTQLELNEARIETGLSESTALCSRPYLPHPCVSLVHFIVKVRPMPLWEGQFWQLSPELVAGFVLCLFGALAFTFGAIVPLPRWLGPSSGWSQSGVWLHQLHSYPEVASAPSLSLTPCSLARCQVCVYWAQGSCCCFLFTQQLLSLSCHEPDLPVLSVSLHISDAKGKQNWLVLK